MAAATTKTFEEKMEDAFLSVERKVAYKPTKTVSALVRKHFERIEALRQHGATYQDICAAIKEKTGDDISVDTLTNVMSKFRNAKNRQQPAKKQAAGGKR
jgi:hypothetical protein